VILKEKQIALDKALKNHTKYFNDHEEYKEKMHQLNVRCARYTPNLSRSILDIISNATIMTAPLSQQETHKLNLKQECAEVALLRTLIELKNIYPNASIQNAVFRRIPLFLNILSVLNGSYIQKHNDLDQQLMKYCKENYLLCRDIIINHIPNKWQFILSDLTSDFSEDELMSAFQKNCTVKLKSEMIGFLQTGFALWVQYENKKISIEKSKAFPAYIEYKKSQNKNFDFQISWGKYNLNEKCNIISEYKLFKKCSSQNKRISNLSEKHPRKKARLQLNKKSTKKEATPIIPMCKPCQKRKPVYGTMIKMLNGDRKEVYSPLFYSSPSKEALQHSILNADDHVPCKLLSFKNE
jgi:hypothetical protein